jgi:hypothetical protein
MSANKNYLQKLVRKTTTLLKSAPMLTVPQAMRAANFSSAQSADPTLQMRVGRALKKSKVDDIPPPNNVELTSPMPTVSTLEHSQNFCISTFSHFHYFLSAYENVKNPFPKKIELVCGE